MSNTGQHATTMFFPHFVGDVLVWESRTSSANGAFSGIGRYESVWLRGNAPQDPPE